MSHVKKIILTIIDFHLKIKFVLCTTTQSFISITSDTKKLTCMYTHHGDRKNTKNYKTHERRLNLQLLLFWNSQIARIRYIGTMRALGAVFGLGSGAYVMYEGVKECSSVC